MPDQSSTFRDFGILPDDLRPPPGRIHCFLSAGHIVVQYLLTGLFATIGLTVAAVVLLTTPIPLNLVGATAIAVGVAALIFLGTHNDYSPVDLEGNILRATHVYTGRVVERSIDEIECLATIVLTVRHIETVVIEKLLGRVKGIEIRFGDRRTPLRVMRAGPPMTDAEELIKAILYRMQQRGGLETEVVEFAGQPLIHRIYWKGQPPSPPPKKKLKTALGTAVALGMLFGAMLFYMGVAEQEERAVASVPPQQITLQALIDHGPGVNRHVTLTDFKPGGYSYESDSDAWTRVSVALFPADAVDDKTTEIKVVLTCDDVENETALATLLQNGQVTGICSSEPRRHWGTELGPMLESVNDGRKLTAAWSIDEMSDPPSHFRVTAMLSAAMACFATVVASAIVIFWKAD
jgi:hypothetical protein